MIPEASETLRNVRVLISESKKLLKKALEAVKKGELDEAEKLALEAMKELEEAADLLTNIEGKVWKEVVREWRSTIVKSSL
ncbi:MAG: PTS lactose/cellobiose transporter subunit IIA [Thermoprotei archaeon]|nr:PTS lactose/cellobiose transporter subunit IIA [Thermoprotei archaeon]